MPEVVSIEINELKIRYRYKINKYFNGSFFKNVKSFFFIIKKMKEISINNIFISETEDPNIIETGTRENKNKK